ncbi:hypothetical protein ICN32_10550 [Polynucleobacter wuianus]|uniref:hypothetical protein n=1 Tax=Polynucleobacter wuianus TaxID=1743168 RepID=UPI001C0D4196|nr:hypothetical protein [Polynucleobacter wuianus]MBU3610992.1 hypothetical protein [Polynucleobacter wuianus]
MNAGSGDSSRIVIDLDGTLIRTDLLTESASKFALTTPFAFFYIFLWLLKGRAYLKSRLAALVDLDVAALPYDQSVLKWIADKRKLGYSIVLATASNIKYASQVSEHLGLFDEVFASDAHINLKGAEKARVLNERYGVCCYEYLGNSTADIPIWKSCSIAHAANFSRKVEVFLRNGGKRGDLILNKSTLSFDCIFFIRALRPHQSLKNLLVFIPLLAAHQLFIPNSFR